MVLKGTGFTIRGWKKGDQIPLQKHANNPNVSCYLMDRFPYPYTMEAAVFWVNSLLKQKPLLNFAIAINDKVVGGIGLETRDDVYRKTAVIGYWLSEDLWGKGIMPEAVKIVTQYAFNNFNFIRIQASIYSKNPRSMRVLEKAGYQKEAVLRSAVIKNNEVMDEYVYAILRSDIQTDK